jgi:hypothetical protein
MKIYRQIINVFSLLALTAVLSSCSRPHDLDTPCPDYGKQCSQALINT